MDPSFALLLLCAFVAATAKGTPCPPEGGTVVITVSPPNGLEWSRFVLSGELREASCDDQVALSESYSLQAECADGTECSFAVEGLAPGEWIHRIAVTEGTSEGQRQARRRLVLDRSAGIHEVAWRLFRTVLTVDNTDDDLACEGCLRQALVIAEVAQAPILIQFAESAVGDIVLFDVLPELGRDSVTIDGLDFDGSPNRRTIEVNALPRAALRIRSSGNHVIGLRMSNSGGNSDLLLIEGDAANENIIESLQIVGRSLEFCQVRGEIGCVIDGECLTADRLTPRGHCGDDGIAVRDNAGANGVNILRDVDVTGAFDKGIKVSEGAVAIIEHSRVHGNTDGGIQATLGGTLSAVENVSERNRGTASANGIAANGPRVGGSNPATLVTRGNLVRDNSLRGISVRSLSHAMLRDDFVCGNGTAPRATGFGLAVIDAAGFSALADVRGVAFVHNERGGVATDGNSVARLGNDVTPGLNAFAFNGIAFATPSEVRNLSAQPLQAIGNHWDHCGPGYRCNEIAVHIGAIDDTSARVDISPARPTTPMRAPTITEIRPTFARAGELVWVYGTNFDAIGAAAQHPGCYGAGRPCRLSDPNCVLLGRTPAEIVAATPTLLVIRAPLTCVEPVQLAARTRRSRGFARTTFCTVESPAPDSRP